jgi:endonuclease G
MKCLLISILVLVSSSTFATSLLPNCQYGEQIQHQYYDLCYSETHEQSFWTAHLLTYKSVKGRAKRSNDFRFDPNVSTGSATTEDYTYSGYDRGHLVPAADMKLNKIAMSETFFLSNISPQSPRFNQGIWRKVENFVRAQVTRSKNVFVITGPVLEKRLPTIGSNVSIPKYFYKIIFNNDLNKPKAISFLLPNRPLRYDIMKYKVSIDEIEEKTGLDFFHQLPKRLQNLFEKRK